MRTLNQFELNTISGGTCDAQEFQHAANTGVFQGACLTGFGFVVGGCIGGLLEMRNGMIPLGPVCVGACVFGGFLNLVLGIASGVSLINHSYEVAAA